MIVLHREDRLKIELKSILTWEHHHVLQLLYAPLIGRDALLLYDLLADLSAMPQKVKNHLLLQKISGLSMEALETSRTILEQFLLVRTYYDGIRNAYLYELYLPKEGSQFLTHDVFGRLYLQKMGKQVYEYMKRCFAVDPSDMDAYQDISAHINALFTNWDDTKEQMFSELRPTLVKSQPQFNFDLFLNGLSLMILPLNERTKENLDFIAEKADIYGIDEKEMQKLVGRSINIRENKLDHARLVQNLQNHRKAFIRKTEDPYALAPIRFLQEKQHGIAVSKADQHLIDAVLNETYHLQPQVINVLIEYVLERCHQSLSRSYVEKVAATWVRLGIDTKEKALEVVRKENENTKPKQKQKSLPQWYLQQDDNSEEKETIDDEALMEELRKLREQHG